MKKCLIILTSEFPFSAGEPFLESEIKYQKQCFDKVIILAQDLDSSVKEAREVPVGVDYYNVSQKSKKISRLGDVLKGAAHIFKKDDMLPEDAEKCNTPIKKVFSKYFNQRAERQFGESLKILQKYDFSDFDEVAVYSYWFFVTCRIGALIKKWLLSNGINSCLISRAHGYDLYESANPLNFLPYRNTLAAECDKIYVCSHQGAEHLKEVVPKYKDKIVTAYLGTVDYGMSSASSTFHIVTCSRISNVKRLDKLIDSLASLNGTKHEIYWTHIGDGKDRERLKERADKELSFMNCEFVGKMSNTDVYKYYTEHPVSLFINVSSSEGLPVSVMEAMSFGIPVLATDVGGTSEIVKDGCNGFLLNADFTAEEFKEKIMSFLNMKNDVYISFRENARIFWKDNFDAEKNYDIFSKELSHITDEKSAPAI